MERAALDAGPLVEGPFLREACSTGQFGRSNVSSRTLTRAGATRLYSVNAPAEGAKLNRPAPNTRSNVTLPKGASRGELRRRYS